MVDEFERPGRSGGAGFYEYARTASGPACGRGCASTSPSPGTRSRSATCRNGCSSPRRWTPSGCLEEGVLTSVADANIGSILGIGFPGWTGGVLQYINGYEGGLPGFVARARELAERYGERFDAARAAGGEGGARGRPSPTPADDS